MRIIYHHRTLGEGAEGVHIAGMIAAFRRLGHEVEVISLLSTGAGEAIERRRRLGRILQVFPRAFYEVAEIAYNLRGYRDVMRAIRSYEPDLVYDRYNLYNNSVVAAARRAKVPVFLEVNTPYAYQRQVYERLALKRLAAWMERRIWREADCVLVVSTPLRQYLQRAGVPSEKIEVLPNGVDLDLFDPSRVCAAPPVHPRSDDSIVIGFVGSLRRWHGLDLLIEAAAPLLRADRRLRLVIAGDGPERSAVEQRTVRLGIGAAVTFLGSVAHEEIPATIAGFEIAVSPRSVFYQSPMKLLEYMAMGKPVVASDTENIRDLIEAGREGILFSPDDPVALREALDRLVRDAPLRAALGTAARLRVERRHTWLGNARRVLEIFQGMRSARPEFRDGHPPLDKPSSALRREEPRT